MKFLEAVGAPFNISSSSCHVKKPKLFSWTNRPGNYPKVVMDSAIYSDSNLNNRPDKYAWVCESMAISYAVDVNKLINDKRVHRSYKKIFLSDKSLLPKVPNSEFCLAGSNLPWVDILNELPEKIRICSMVSSKKDSTPGHKHRLAVAHKYQSRLDLFGGAHGSPRVGYENASRDGHGDKSAVIFPYMFSVVVENAKYDDYFTEKITDCFAGYTIPVYWGCPSIGDYFDTRGIIDLTPDFNIASLTPDLYKSMLPYVIENNKRIKEMMAADDLLYQKITKND